MRLSKPWNKTTFLGNKAVLGGLRMYIAICDDDHLFCDEVRHNIYDYLNNKRLDPVIEIFYCGEELLKSPLNFDIILLDYQMRNLNGIETAHLLRQRNPISTIIFITSFPHVVFDAFTVDTFRFITKPINYSKLYQAFDDYQQMINKHYPIILHTQTDMVKIQTQDIVYIEAQGKHCAIRLVDDTIDYPKTMAKIQALLPSYFFSKVHRQYIVNLCYIEKITNKTILLTNGEKAPISKSYYSSFKSSFEYYVKGQWL